MNIHPGRVIQQRYQIIREISLGAFGITYLAIDLDLPNQPMRIVKCLIPSQSDPQILKFSKRVFPVEAKVLSRLGENDQIPSLFSYFEEDGALFLVQEFIPGHDLTSEFQEGKRWNEAETIKFLKEVLEVLSIVHKQNFIHRDIKPANIMRRDIDGKLLLTDFGVSQEISTVGTSERASPIIYTPYYSSPEQMRGFSGKYSDIYTVGILGIQALTGLRPNEISENLEQPEEMWNNLNLDVSSRLKSVLVNMINPNYLDRYSDASEALKALTDSQHDAVKAMHLSPIDSTLSDYPTHTSILSNVSVLFFRLFNTLSEFLTQTNIDLDTATILQALEFKHLTIENLSYALDIKQEKVSQIINNLYQDGKIDIANKGTLRKISPLMFFRPRKEIRQIHDEATYFTLTFSGYFYLHPLIEIN